MGKNYFEEPFVFMNVEYDNGPDLVKALLENWDIGLSVFIRGDLRGFEDQADRLWGKERFYADTMLSAFQKALHEYDPSLNGIPDENGNIIPYEKWADTLANNEYVRGDYIVMAKEKVFSTYMPLFAELETMVAHEASLEKRAEAGERLRLELEKRKTDV